MAMNWTCHKCGKEANYRAMGKSYCEDHWVMYLDHKLDSKKRAKKDVPRR